eukprot:g10408.t1 g10408   contig4:1820642-1822078(-)
MSAPTSTTTSSSKPIPASISNIQNANWSGSIPIILSLASPSLSSPIPPRPLHKMLPRMTYLHIGLYQEVWQLFEYAPVAADLSGESGVTTREEPPEDDADDGPSSEQSVAMSVNKSSHEKMWDAILTTNFTSYHEVNVELQVGITTSSVSAPTTEQSTKSRDASGGIPRLVPVRVLVNDKRAMQKPCRALANAGSAGKTEAINVHVEDQRTEQQSEGDDAAIDSLIKRLTATSVTPHTTLGDVLASLLPQHFVKDETGTVSDESTYFCIQGIQPSMDCAIVDLWKSLCNPDHFLYIVVVTQ